MPTSFVLQPRRVETRTLAAGFVAVLLAALLPLQPAQAAATGGDCTDPERHTYRSLLECVTVEAVRGHQEAFQEIALAHEGNRAAGSPGYDASADYVAGLLEEAGYEVTRQEFEIPFFEQVVPAALQQVEPDAAAYETAAFTYSGSGDVTGPVIPVDVNLTGDRASTSGCEPEDFDGLDLSGAADVALIQRGTCTFGTKALNAQEAGAEAVVIFNQGDAEDRVDLLVGTLGQDAAGVLTIPVVGASFDTGEALAGDGVVARVSAETFFEIRTTENVIAESPGGDPDNVVMAGAHLDSVTGGPGINDNGSGSAAILETALQMAHEDPVNKLRFAWWGAEEGGLIGSNEYVAGLDEDELDDIALYMNYDMVGSPNYITMVYDADESTFAAGDFGVVVPEGSAAVEDVYESFFTLVGEPYDDTEFSGRSDYQGFILSDIPSAGLFTGAEGIKTEEQEEIWGGVAGMQYDPCYHAACDTYFNVDLHALDVNSDAIAFAMLTFAYSTETVNGVAGMDVPGDLDLPEPAGPEGTRGSTDGGEASFTGAGL